MHADYQLYDQNHYLEWPALEGCVWVPLPDRTIVLLRGPGSDLDRRALIYPVHDSEWGASYEGWNPDDSYSGDRRSCPSTALRERFHSPRAAAGALLQAVEDGFSSRAWKPTDTNWVTLCHLALEGPSHLGRWRNGLAYEVRRWNSHVFHVTRNGSYATTPRAFESDEKDRLTFASAAEAKAYADTIT